MTDTLNARADGIARASAMLTEGLLVAFPTETVYGLGADARQGEAVARIFAAKARPRFNPLIVHVADAAAAQRIGSFDRTARKLADAFWPGPITLVVPLAADPELSPLVTAGLDSVGLRVPAAPVAQALLTEFGGPVAAPSANPSGAVSPTTAAHVLDGLRGRIAAVVDGGPCAVGLESTIVGCTDSPRLLRPGGVPVEAIEAVLGATLGGAPETDAPSSPGQLASHYAPDKPVRLDASAPRPGELWLGFGPDAAGADISLSQGGDLPEAAARLFGALRALDAMEGSGIAVSPIPETGLGRAINDRLRRAAAPRG